MNLNEMKRMAGIKRESTEKVAPRKGTDPALQYEGMDFVRKLAGLETTRPSLKELGERRNLATPDLRVQGRKQKSVMDEIRESAGMTDRFPRLPEKPMTVQRIFEDAGVTVKNGWMKAEWLDEKVAAEPVQRALDRMADAKKRGGFDGMIKDTMSRIKSTKDAGKLAGIATAVETLIVSDEEGMTPEQVHALRSLGAAAKAALGHAGGASAAGGAAGGSAGGSGPGGREHVGGSGGHYKPKGPVAILPAGRIDIATGKNEYWEDGVCEVWSEDGKLFGVVTQDDQPSAMIGAVADFRHDQTGKSLRRGAKMVGWFTIDPKNGKFGGHVPAKGTLPVSTYK